MARPTFLFAAILVLVFDCRKATANCQNTTYYSSQLDLMLAEYDRAQMPAHVVSIKAKLDVDHANIDDKSGTMRLLASMHLDWEDKRLSWNASSWDCDTVVTSSERLWLPDINVLNAVLSGSSSGVGLRARLSNDGHVFWVSKLDLTTPISLKLEAWPQDVQQATFKFGTRFYGIRVNLSIDDFPNTPVFESSTWELLQVKSSKSSWMGGDIIAWQVQLRRRAAAQTLCAGAVMAAATLLLLAAALLPPAARPTLCAPAAFTVALWLISALVRLPGASAAPRTMSLMCAVCVISAIMAIGAAMVLRVARCMSPPPSTLRSLIIATSPFCKLTPPDGSQAECSAWAAAAHLFDRVIVSAVLLSLFIIVCIYVSIA